MSDLVVNEKRVEELFLNLCRINSPSLKEKDVTTWARAYLADQGLEVWEDEAGAKIGGNSNNLIARLKGNLEGAPRVFLSAHFDTVEPTEGLEIVEKDGIWSTGSDTILGADDKGGMAPAIEAVLSLKESGASHGDVYLLLSVAEEIGLKGADALDIESLKLDYGFVLDTSPPVGSFVNQTATHDKLDITIHGRPAHAGKDPENGINAIVVLADAVHGMPMGRIDGETTANLGIISGGSAVNVVCPSVTVRAEARSLSVEKLDKQVNAMVQGFEAAARKFGASVSIDHKRHYRSYFIEENSRASVIAQRAAKRADLEFSFRQTLGGSDANIYNAKGVQTLVMATGMEKIHTHDEQISRVDLIKTARLALAVLLESAKLDQ